MLVLCGILQGWCSVLICSVLMCQVAKLPTVRSDMSLSVMGSKFVLVGGCVGTQVQYCPQLTNATTVFDAGAVLICSRYDQSNDGYCSACCMTSTLQDCMWQGRLSGS